MPPRDSNDTATERYQGGDRDDYRDLVKTELCEVLDSLGIGVAYERAHGDSLFWSDGGRESGVLDLVGGFGSTILGHNHPELVAALQAQLTSGRPFHAQASKRVLAGKLARRLNERLPAGYRMVLANSGAEAIEAALKHAIMASGCRTFLALEGAFHGTTLGAVQLTDTAGRNDQCRVDGLEVVRVRPNDLEHFERQLDTAGPVAGFVFEPVLGEGGIRPLTARFAQGVAARCAEAGIPLIADEIQTGVGRTGRFLACEDLGVRPDYVTLSKALGGGLTKIAALLIRSELYQPGFGRVHTSTYAEDDHSCAVALRTLELIDDDALAACRRKGRAILHGLREVQQMFPAVLADVRGRGLLIGFELRRIQASPSLLLKMLSDQGDLALAVVSYLFHRHGVRVAPPLGDPWSLRVEPSVLIGEAQIRHLLHAIGDVCAKIAAADGCALTEFLRPGSISIPAAHAAQPAVPINIYGDDAEFLRRQVDAPEHRVAWLCHMVDGDDLVAVDPSFARQDHEQLERTVARLGARARPVVINSVDITSAVGSRVRLHAIMLPWTSRGIAEHMGSRRHRLVRRAVDQALGVAHRLGCQTISLGQFTSMVTANGRAVADDGRGLTTGNTYTAATTVRMVENALADLSRDPSDAVLAIVGAAGNIGTLCAGLLAPRFCRTILVGSDRPGSAARLRRAAANIPAASVATDFAAVRTADVVIACVNAVEPPLRPEHFKPGAVVCDLSVPAAIDARLRRLRPDVLCFRGGVAVLPRGEDLEIPGLGLPVGHAYGCMAEGILLGLEGCRHREFTGQLGAEHVDRITSLATRHGFAPVDWQDAAKPWRDSERCSRPNPKHLPSSAARPRPCSSCRKRDFASPRREFRPAI